ncbi:MAG: hypothetical protein IJM43_07585 [Bacteroidaceae bacterium]|nr:hypothetical protein [Bacteroidaceae bacterium]
METMKKQWGKALVGVQEFVPQEFIAACAPDQTYVTYKFWCNAGSGDYSVWEETNGVPGLQRSPEWNTEDWSWTPADKQWAGSNGQWGSYHPCNKAHEVTVKKGESVDYTFPYGYIRKQGEYDPQTINVRLWLDDPRGSNIHCTENLSMDEYTEHNPS